MGKKKEFTKGIIFGVISDVIVGLLLYLFPLLPRIPEIIRPFWWVILPVVFVVFFVGLEILREDEGGTGLASVDTEYPNYVQDTWILKNSGFGGGGCWAGFIELVIYTSIWKVHSLRIVEQG